MRRPPPEGPAVVGTPDDAIAQIRRLQTKPGDLGVVLQLAHTWADFDKTRTSFELWRRHVSPAINQMNDPRQESFDRAAGHAPEFIQAAINAAASAIARHAARTG